MKNYFKKSQWPYVDIKLKKLLIECISSNKFNYHTGEKGKLFEKNFANYHNIKHAHCISNATIGLEIALISLGIKKNDEVLVTPRSYFTSVSCISRVGARPIFADIKDDLTIDPKDIEKKITPKTKAIICVHISGFPCDMKNIIKIAKKNDLKIIEDCSQAHGAKIGDRFVGSFGDISVWSFCNDKIISTLGEGGMISAKKDHISKRIWSLKDNGKNFSKFYNQSKVNNFKYLHDFIGTNARMTELQAIAGQYQLELLEKNIKKRNKIASIYTKILSNSKIFKAITVDQNNTCAYYKYPFFLDLDKIKKGVTYQQIMNYLGSFRPGVTVGCCPTINYEIPYRNMKTSIKNAKDISRRLISFSIHHRMDLKSILLDAKQIKKYFDTIS